MGILESTSFSVPYIKAISEISGANFEGISDASVTGCGAILLQDDHPMAFDSYEFTDWQSIPFVAVIVEVVPNSG